MRAAGSPLFLADADTDMRNPGGRPGGRITEHLASEQAAIEMTLAMVNPHALDELADRLATARRVRVQGYRNSHFVAEYFRTALSNFRPDVQMIGAAGRLYISGATADVTTARDRITTVLAGIEGRDH